MRINRAIIIFLSVVLLGNAFLNCSTQVKKDAAADNKISAVPLKEDHPGNAVTDVSNPDDFPGEYEAYISNFKAIITLRVRNNKFYGEIRFSSPGSGVPQPLKDLTIADNKIYFIRSVETEEELKKYGSSRFFKQTFHGGFSADRKKIKGYFIESGAESSWGAFKKE
ncbi:MAG: hypothetical protein JW864_17020 [Spirochaetes bacterium]|nr:hypothetical protein [Spirochaetota bacterium]